MSTWNRPSARTTNWGSGLPNERVRFLSMDEALAIHDRVIEAFGGNGELVDKGALESALFRPQTGYYADLAEMAAALFESLLVNHPFTDGNKRVAFFGTDTFLRMNGWCLIAEPQEGYATIIAALEAEDRPFEVLLPWIRRCLKAL